MKKLFLSLTSFVFAGAILAGGTGAFLNDSQTSTGNTFASGLVTLQYDNESFATDDLGKLAASTSTTWSLSGLEGKLFYDFPDVKPGDIGEDTVSLHVNNNNSWACMALKITGTSGNPAATSTPNTGELQNDLQFALWGDDGDNVYETGEKIFAMGSASTLFAGQEWALADSAHNIWGASGPLLGATTEYIGEAWCFGTLTPAPVAQDGKGYTGTNGPLVRGTGFTCNGAAIGDGAEGNSISLNVSFIAEQARNNDSFLCSSTSTDPITPPPPQEATSTLFFENFNSCTKDPIDDGHSYHDFDWSKNWSCHITSGDKQCTQNAVLDAGGSNHTDVLTTPLIDAAGYHTITLSYDRSTSGGSATKLVVAFSPDGGATWTTLETVSGNAATATKTFSLSPAADDKPDVQIRFTLTGTTAGNQATIDNVLVTGVSP